MQSRSLGACLWVRSRRQTTRVLLAWLFGHILLRLRCVCLDALRLVRLYACRKASELPRRHTACLTALMQLVSGPDDWRNEPHET